MKNNSKNLIVSSVAALLFGLLFIFMASGKESVTKFDIYLGAVWVPFLSFIVTLSLVHVFNINDNK